ncbi:hypothetical protein D5S17_22475 [Pseudonocardiaceae bacterium YIM PH 21723]|nr:hypothetical protein D5S17_22475 [Pseudonocardiaceae bacterium YIM PH 21723]
MTDTVKPAPELLLDAVDQLDPEHRRQVLAWLITRPDAPALPTLRGSIGESLLHAELEETGSGDRQRVRQQMVPVRFPADQHAQLRDWCQENGFSMATVIRGLVSRFLEQQAKQ